jgi:LysM repeat protein
MSKKTFYSVLLVLAALTLVLAAVAGCSRPKPEAKETPAPDATEVVATQTPDSAPTQIIAEPTVITTKPTEAAGEPTTAPSESEGATPTPVVIAPATAVPTTAVPASTPVAGESEGGGEWFLYTLQWGDTLYSLAARYDTTVEAISALNNIKPDDIQAGQQIKIPQSGGVVPPQPGESVEYVVQAGDDLNLIATKFGVSVASIVQANGLSNPDFIYVGQKLVISSGGETTPMVSSEGTTHVVKPGESVDSIAGQYDTTREAIVSANNLVNPNWIYVGQVLTIP